MIPDTRLSQQPDDGRQPDRQLARKQWLAALLLRRRPLLSRFALFYQRLRQLPRRTRRVFRRRAALTVGGLALALALTRAPAHAANITVDDGFVDIAADGNCSLIEAIINANDGGATYADCVAGDPGGNTITLPSGGSFTITASFASYYDSDTGLPLIDSEITVEGNGSTIARDTGAANFRLLAVSNSGDLTLNDLTLSDGYAYGPGYDEGDGGAIYSLGRLVINDSTLTNNTADGNGGALYTRGRLILNNSTISDNTANYEGGGLAADTGTITISGSTISGNTTASNYGSGGGLDFQSVTVTIENSTISDNDVGTYGYGGGIDSDDGELTISNSTISGNEAGGNGGGLNANETLLTISNSTISGNEAGNDGGGVYLDDSGTTISNSTISGNTADEDGGGVYADDAGTVIRSSTISDNTAGYDGGGLFNDVGTTNLINSTISGNTAGYDGGGVANDEGTVVVTNSTVTGNTAATAGGGIANGVGGYYDGLVDLNRSLISGNDAPSGREIYNDDTFPAVIVQRNNFNVVGYSGDAGIDGFTLGATDVVPTEALADILDPTLANNGGPTETHALVTGSPAVDLAPSAACLGNPVQGVDQRGEPRNADGDGSASANECDAGAFELAAAVGDATIYMTAAGPGTTDDAVNFGKEDILFWDSGTWSLFFDGTAEGLTTKHDINAIHVNDANDLYLSFFQNKIMTAGVGQVFGHDVIHFDGSGFSLFFDGSKVELTTVGEKIDALHILDGSVSPIGGGSCDFYLLISTLGSGRVMDFNDDPLRFSGEDILGFCMTDEGVDTEGLWHLVLDGSDEGMPANSTDSISASADGEVIFLTTKGTFNVDSANGGSSEVYRFDVTSGDFSGPFFSAPDEGLEEKVDGLHVEGDLP